MKVVYYDVEAKLPMVNAVVCHALKDLLKKSDVVSLHVPELLSTKNHIGRTQLNWMKSTSVLINYSIG